MLAHGAPHGSCSPGKLRSCTAGACVHRQLRSNVPLARRHVSGTGTHVALNRQLPPRLAAQALAPDVKGRSRSQGHGVGGVRLNDPIVALLWAATPAVVSVDAACDRSTRKLRGQAGVPRARRVATWRCHARRRGADAVVQRQQQLCAGRRTAHEQCGLGRRQPPDAMQRQLQRWAPALASPPAGNVPAAAMRRAPLTLVPAALRSGRPRLRPCSFGPPPLP